MRAPWWPMADPPETGGPLTATELQAEQLLLGRPVAFRTVSAETDIERIIRLHESSTYPQPRR